MTNEFYSETLVAKARKAHVCVESGCKRDVKPGDSYVRVAGVTDGEFWAVKLCARCKRSWDRAIARFPGSFRYGEGPPWGGLAEWLAEMRRP